MELLPKGVGGTGPLQKPKGRIHEWTGPALLL
jgi:hypothetical protein